MEVLPTRLEGPILLQPKVFRDERGFFHETYRRNRASTSSASTDEFVQDNHSRSAEGSCAGCTSSRAWPSTFAAPRGEIVDVLVDIRKGSPTFGEWEAFTLNDENLRQLYCPDGFAHGFCVTSEVADVIYMCSTYYDPETESGISYRDPDVGIEWPDIDLTPRRGTPPPRSSGMLRVGSPSSTRASALRRLAAGAQARPKADDLAL